MCYNLLEIPTLNPKKIMKKQIERFIHPGIVVFAAAALRLLPHLPNFAPIGAMALFGGTYLSKKQALILPIAAMVVSDFFIGFDSFISRVSVYGSFLLIVGIGMWLRGHKSFANVVSASLASSILFFLITNAVVWVAGSYDRGFVGLWQSYLAGVPFFRGTLFGDLFYTGAFFAGFELVRSQVKSKKLGFVDQGVKN